jgi:hypothetical protein
LISFCSIKERDSLFTDLLEFVIVELRKRPVEPDHTARWNWARFFGGGNDAEVVRSMKGEGLDTALISKITGLPEDEIEKMPS